MTIDKKCQYFLWQNRIVSILAEDDKGVGGDCWEEQNGKAKFRKEFGVFFCDHHNRKLSEVMVD